MSGHDVHQPTLYFDPHFSMAAAKILPGQYYVTARDMVIVTVLGSCVAACIRDPVQKVGGMNHFMLPDLHLGDLDTVSAPARYGSYAMELLINHVIKAGGQRDRLQAKVFGGGQVLAGFTVSNIGEQNAEFVESYLRKEGIDIIARDLLDIYPRKVYFFPSSGRVMVKRLKSAHNDTIIQREREYVSRLSKDKVSGDVDLF